MTTIKTPVATDSAAELHDLIGDDATATFEADPKFIDSDPTGNASSENIEVQRDTDDLEDSEEEEEEFEDEDGEEDDEDDDDDELEDEDDDEEAEAAEADSPDTDRVVDAALRMNALVAVASEYAANA